MRIHGWRWSAAAAAVVLLVADWIALRPGGDHHSSHPASTENYLPGVAADVYLPSSPAGRTPVVVLIPGGGWRTADRRGLGPLAETLAAHGMVAVNATYRAADSGVRFPVPVSDVVCAVDFAADRARRAGIAPGPVIVLGHSSGAHLAALAALAGAHFRKDCPYPAVRVDGLVGLSGPYNILLLQGVAYPLFGTSGADAPAAWREGNPMTWLTSRRDLPALLAHGAADDVVSPTFTRTFAEALEAAGHPVELKLVPGAGHQDIYLPAVIADPVIAWISALTEVLPS
jgi:acetyl esterase/lipase